MTSLFWPGPDSGGDDRDEAKVAVEAMSKNSSKDTTLVSELATGLGMIRRTLPEAMEHIPSELVGVPQPDWQTLQSLFTSRKHTRLFESSFANGRAFAESDVALRHRQPREVEWCGRRKLRGEGTIPADLRIDHVYLVSCKYDSKNILNSGPAKLFDNRLRDGRQSAVSWYEEVAPRSYQAYYSAVRTFYELDGLPVSVGDLTSDQRGELTAVLPRLLPSGLQHEQSEFCAEVSEASAARWRRSIGHSPQDKTDFAMTLLRIPQAVYFLLGQGGSSPHRFKVLSRWDWANRFRLVDFAVSSSTAMQPTVNWSIEVGDRLSGEKLTAKGHVEVRWSHGRFNKAPEAKVYLDSPLGDTPGFIAL
jgi:hypothetical protein